MSDTKPQTPKKANGPSKAKRIDYKPFYDTDRKGLSELCKYIQVERENNKRSIDSIGNEEYETLKQRYTRRLDEILNVLGIGGPRKQSKKNREENSITTIDSKTPNYKQQFLKTDPNAGYSFNAKSADIIINLLSRFDAADFRKLKSGKASRALQDELYEVLHDLIIVFKNEGATDRECFEIWETMCNSLNLNVAPLQYYLDSYLHAIERHVTGSMDSMLSLPEDKYLILTQMEKDYANYFVKWNNIIELMSFYRNDSKKKDYSSRILYKSVRDELKKSRESMDNTPVQLTNNNVPNEAETPHIKKDTEVSDKRLLSIRDSIMVRLFQDFDATIESFPNSPEYIHIYRKKNHERVANIDTLYNNSWEISTVDSLIISDAEAIYQAVVNILYNDGLTIENEKAIRSLMRYNEAAEYSKIIPYKDYRLRLCHTWQMGRVHYNNLTILHNSDRNRTDTDNKYTLVSAEELSSPFWGQGGYRYITGTIKSVVDNKPYVKPYINRKQEIRIEASDGCSTFIVAADALEYGDFFSIGQYVTFYGHQCYSRYGEDDCEVVGLLDLVFAKIHTE